jgi:hypothetical protein
MLAPFSDYTIVIWKPVPFISALFDLDACYSVLSFGSSFLLSEAKRISSKSDLV